MSDHYEPSLEDAKHLLPADIYKECVSQFDFKQKAPVNNVTIRTESFDRRDDKAVNFSYGTYIPQYGSRKGISVSQPSYSKACNKMRENNEQVAGKVHTPEEKQPSKKALFKPSSKK